MKGQICSYLDSYNISRRVDGYDLLVQIISLTLENGCGSLRSNMEAVCKESGITHGQLRGRLRYAIEKADVPKDKATVQNFVKTAVFDLLIAKGE